MWSYWAPGHSATLSTLAPESVPCQCPPASPQALQRWRISSRDRANPGTGVGRHPTSEEHLDSPSRARTRSPARRLDKPLAARPSCGKLLSALRPLWRGRPDATSTQQVGRAYPSHPTLLSVGGCKRGSTPRSSYTTPSTLPREEGASSFSRTGGTAGWLLNLRPGTRGYGLLRRPADQRAGCPGHASPLSDPRQGVCSLRGQPPQATPRCGSRLHGGPRTLHSMRLPAPAPWAGATVESWTTREGRPLRGPCPALLDSRTVDVRVSLPACEIYAMGGSDSPPAYPLPARHVARWGRGDFTVYLGVSSAAT
jgi:hypothetical protein